MTLGSTQPLTEISTRNISYTTVRKVAGSIPAGVNGFFIDIKSHYDPGVDSASNRNEYQEHFLGVKSGRCLRLTTYHHPVPLSRNLGTLTTWNPLGLSRPFNGTVLLLPLEVIRPRETLFEESTLKRG